MITIPEGLILARFSSKRDSTYIKGSIQKIKIKDDYKYQISLFTEKQVFHTNVDFDSLECKVNEIMDNYFFQCQLVTKEYIYGYRYTKKGNLLTNRTANKENVDVKDHNKEKKYIINDGMIVPPLIDLSILTPDGFVVKKNYDKFKQINRFLEIIEDVIKDEKELNIIDFGCGKSYLTFILYYYLVEIKKMKVHIIGLDLKSDVIKECNEIRDKYGYKDLDFQVGDISLYKPDRRIDMIITLHACDKATDYALYHAIMLNTKYILSVPCCQHEINLQLKTDKDNLIYQYGILKERYSAIITDAIRGNILKYFGYDVSIMEFIDMVHSPKNLLIRAIKRNDIKNEKYLNQVKDILAENDIHQELYEMIKRST